MYRLDLYSQNQNMMTTSYNKELFDNFLPTQPQSQAINKTTFKNAYFDLINRPILRVSPQDIILNALFNEFPYSQTTLTPCEHLFFYISTYRLNIYFLV